mmetsp:Transcript_28631/g.64615  ORF Transcript_28631/g.64615 Transcript_28631/m.64615 type:complete len:293 (-) Transcript_28631:857-1735(-)
MDAGPRALEPRRGTQGELRRRVRHRAEHRGNLLEQAGTPQAGLQVRRARELPVRHAHVHDGVRELGVLWKIPPAGPRGRNGLLDGGLRHGRPVVQRVQLRGGRGAGRRDARRVPAVPVESRGGLAGHQVHGQHREELAALREGLHHDADTAERHWVQRLLATAVVRRAYGTEHKRVARRDLRRAGHIGQSPVCCGIHVDTKVQHHEHVVHVHLAARVHCRALFLLQAVQGFRALVVGSTDEVVTDATGGGVMRRGGLALEASRLRSREGALPSGSDSEALRLVPRQRSATRT